MGVSRMSIVINMTKAKEIKKELVRQERKPLFEILDVKYIQALEMGDSGKQADIVAKKQALRDATTHSSIVNASTPEELKNARPPALDMVI